MVKYEKAFINFALQDDNFKEEYLTYKGSLIGFEDFLKQIASYCFNDDYFNPFLDKPYLDYCYLKICKKYINLDDIFELFKNDLMEV